MTQSLKIKEGRKAVASVDIALEMIDGFVYTVIPGSILYELGIEPYKEIIFKTWTEDEEDEMNGKMIEICRKVGEAYFEFNGIGAMSPVVFGEENDKPTIGGATLGTLGLMIDDGIFVPMTMLL